MGYVGITIHLSKMKSKEILNELNTDFPQIGKIKRIEILHKNPNSINYLVTSSNGKFVIKNFHEGSNWKKIESMCIIMQSCSHKSKVEKPILNKSKKFVNKKRKFYITKFQDGNYYKGNPNELKDLTKQLALFHKAISNEKFSFNYRTNQNLHKILTYSELLKIKSKIKSKRTKNIFDKQLLTNFEIIKNQCYLDKTFSKIIFQKRIKKQLIHDDLHRQNLLFQNNKLSVILDFTTLKKGYVINDVLFCSLRFSLYKSKKISLIQKYMNLFLTTYLQYNSIDKKEIDFAYYFLNHKILRGLSFLIKKHYFKNYFDWDDDLAKYLHFLQIVKKLILSKNQVLYTINN